MPDSVYVIGVDYGTDSVRSLLVNARSGEELASSVFYYPRWKKGLYCNPANNQFRQHPLDYVEGLESTIKDCLRKAGDDIAKKVKAISVDTTGSTPVAVDSSGVPLAMLPAFAENPNAMFVLWKDHTATNEAAQINEHAAKFPVNYLQFEGGIYSSEWFWAKLLHILRIDTSVRDACYSWVEHCDWIPFLLTGGNDIRKMKRSACAAGHKALWAEAFGGFPPNDFFKSLDPLLDGFTGRLFQKAETADQSAGNLSEEWAQRLGLPTDVAVGVGAFDAHVGAVGGQIEANYLCKVMGTSTCDILVAPQKKVEGILVNGICGQVPGSVIPGMLGMEAGQSAFGDTYAWFKNLLSWPLKNILQHNSILESSVTEALIKDAEDKIIRSLSEAAEQLPLDDKSELSLDWLNGRRTPDANQMLKATISGLNLGTDAPRFFRSLVEATCFGAKAIVNRFIEQGISIKGVIGLGGVALKSPYIMQVMADVLDMPIKIHKSEQTCAAGAAMFAATVAGIYPDVEAAMKSMGKGFEKEYFPDKSKTELYARRYQRYLQLGALTEKHLTI